MGETTDEVRSTAGFTQTTESASNTATTRKVDEPAEGGQEAAQIRSGIEQTRANLSETIGALQEKLDPANIAEQVKDQIREKATEAYDTAKTAVKEATIGKAGKIVSSVSEAVSNLTGNSGTSDGKTSSPFVQYIRDNPVPLALVGIGLGMLAWNKRGSSQTTYRNTWPNKYGNSGVSTGSAGDSENGGLMENARAVAGRATTAVSSAAGSVKDAAGAAVDTTRQKLTSVSDQAKQRAQTAGDQLKTTLQDNPLALGVAALAAGAIVGLSLPATRVEGEYMGKARDRLVDQAKSVAQETAQKVQRVTQEAGRTLKDVAQKEGLPVGQSNGQSA